MDTTTLIDRVKITLEQVGTDCPLEEMMDLCPDLTWNQMFLAIDDLSRRGEVQVTIEGNNVLTVVVSFQNTKNTELLKLVQSIISAN